MAKTTITHEGLYALSIAELESLYRLINEGFYGYSTKNIEVEAKGYQYGHEKWKERLVEREELLKEIREMMKNKIRIILL